MGTAPTKELAGRPHITALRAWVSDRWCEPRFILPVLTWAPRAVNEVHSITQAAARRPFSTCQCPVKVLGRSMVCFGGRDPLGWRTRCRCCCMGGARATNGRPPQPGQISRWLTCRCSSRWRRRHCALNAQQDCFYPPQGSVSCRCRRALRHIDRSRPEFENVLQ